MEGEKVVTVIAFDKLFTALSKAQGEFPKIEHDGSVSVKPKSEGSRAYTFTYATLGGIIEATKAVLTKNGLCITWLLNGSKIILMLGHSSGQYLESTWDMNSPREKTEGAKSDGPSRTLQESGSELTYRKRYMLSAMLGISAETDDDGNASDGNQSYDFSKFDWLNKGTQEFAEVEDLIRSGSKWQEAVLKVQRKPNREVSVYLEDLAKSVASGKAGKTEEVVEKNPAAKKGAITPPLKGKTVDIKPNVAGVVKTPTPPLVTKQQEPWQNDEPEPVKGKQPLDGDPGSITDPYLEERIDFLSRFIKDIKPLELDGKSDKTATDMFQKVVNMDKAEDIAGFLKDDSVMKFLAVCDLQLKKIFKTSVGLWYNMEHVD